MCWKLKKSSNLQNTQKAETSKASFGDKFSVSFAWWPYLAGAGLLLAAYFAADFWRRRRQSQQLDNADDVWDVLDTNSNNVVYYKELDLADTLLKTSRL